MSHKLIKLIASKERVGSKVQGNWLLSRQRDHAGQVKVTDKEVWQRKTSGKGHVNTYIWELVQ